MTAAAPRQQLPREPDRAAATRETVRRYHDSWVSKDFAAAAALLAPDVRVEVPINTYPTRESFVAALAEFAGMTQRVIVLDEFARETTAMLLYDMDVRGLGRLRVAEHFTVEGGVIQTLRQIHDTHAIREAGFARG